MNKGMIHSADSSITVEIKIMTLIRRIKTLKTPSAPHISQVNQLQTPTCFNCCTSNHVTEESPLLMNPIEQIPEQANALYQ